MKSVFRGLFSIILGVVVFLTANGMFVRWMAATQFEEKATYDVAAASLTVLTPAVVAGFVVGLVGGDAAVVAFVFEAVIFALLDLIHGPVWKIPGIGGAAAGGFGMRVLVRSPLTLVFGILTAWIGAQFASGRFTLADREHVFPAPDQD